MVQHNGGIKRPVLVVVAAAIQKRLAETLAESLAEDLSEDHSEDLAAPKKSLAISVG